jgi:hypothetical protein
MPTFALAQLKTRLSQGSFIYPWIFFLLIFLLLTFVSSFPHKLKRKLFTYMLSFFYHSHKGLYTCSTEPSTQQ